MKRTRPSEKQVIRRLIAVIEEVIDLEPDDYGVRQIPPGFLDKARSIVNLVNGGYFHDRIS